MKATTHTPVRRLPARAARDRGKSGPAPPTTPRARPGGRVTRSSNPAGSATKRAASPLLPTSAKRSRRSQSNAVFYGESSGDEDEASVTSDDSDTPLVSPTPTKSRTRQTGPSTGGTKTKKSGSSTALTKSTPTKVIQKSRPHDGAQSQDDTEPPTIPPWERLPYYVLLRIFECAAGTPVTQSGAKWLLDVSTVCHAFTEPALTALYRRPPLLNLQMAHGFTELLARPPGETSFNYRQKVEALEIDVGTIASKTFRGQQLDFQTLLQNAPRLAHVDIWHEKDQPPYRELDKNIKWSYPAQLFRGLGIISAYGPQPGEVAADPSSANSSVPRLQSWVWSRRMMAKLPLEKLGDIHKSVAFHGLRKITFTNFQLPSLNAADPEDPEIVQADHKLVGGLTRSIDVLPDLKHLVMECSTAVNGTFLSLLPKSIEHLEIINCWEVKADHMAEYLLSHGNGLRHLTLHHNQSLSLAFLPVLGKACPRLESLRMNLSYFNLHAFYRDSDPAYDTLLTADQVPQWPASLRYLDLKNLRRWDEAAAEIFFQSLLDSAPTLPHLRHLEVKAMLDIPFRERSRLRDKWEAKLKHAFLRKWVDPLPNFTLRPRPQPLATAGPPQTPKGARQKKKTTGAAKTLSQRRSTRIATLPSGSASRASSVGRARRDTGARPFYAEPDTDEDIVDGEGDDDDGGDGESDEGEQRPEPSRRSSLAAREEAEAGSVQGLCDVVDVRFDNQKPVENQFRMDDFLDDESNDPTDEDWDEDVESDHGYAW